MRLDQRVCSVRRWPGMRSKYIWLPPDGSVTTTKANQVGVSFSAHRKAVHQVGDRTNYLDIPAGAVFANGSQAVRWAEVSEPTEAVEIYPDLGLLHAAAGRQAGEVEIEPVAAARDATVVGVAAVLKRAHVGEIDLDALEASTLSHRLAAHLAEQYCHPRSPRAHRNGWLDRTVIDQIAAFVDDRLGEQITLDDLAAHAHLSPYHFARAFKRSTGLAPHQFVTMRRMERAKAQLLSTRHSVSEIAHALGYSNVSHFRRLFRRNTGFRPSDLRRGR
jgi:AraC family transcriptional regulator